MLIKLTVAFDLLFRDRFSVFDALKLVRAEGDVLEPVVPTPKFAGTGAIVHRVVIHRLVHRIVDVVHDVEDTHFVHVGWAGVDLLVPVVDHEAA